jgi:hypothetical protein
MSRRLAQGWATVELERAAIELADRLRPGAAFEPTARSPLLGARCLRGVAVGDGEWIVLLEPDTEGRLAAYLARNGEGWAVTWLASDVGGATPPGATVGPLGREWLEEEGLSGSPFRLRVTPATIEP